LIIGHARRWELFMVSVSIETPEQGEERLRRVIAAADFVRHEGVWCFRESPADQPPTLTADTLAVVRDQDSWSCLVPASGQESGDVERFGIFSFHFPTRRTTAASSAGWPATSNRGWAPASS
jgi:hypothetical protein